MSIRHFYRFAAIQVLAASAIGPALARHHSPSLMVKQPAAQRKTAAHVDDVLVWVDLRTSIYYLPGDWYWGKTITGEYMSESAALAAGYRERQIGE